jgi:hypothetical protein
MALASAACLRPTPIAVHGTPPARNSYLLPIPTSLPAVPRSADLIGDGAKDVLVQQYGGLNDQPALGLRSAVLISDARAISRLVHELNALPAYPGTPMWCGFGDGSYFAADFTYVRGNSTTVKVEASG